MIWIIASAPFWFISVLLTSIGIYGCGMYLYREFRSAGTDTSILWGGLVLTLSGGLLMIFAAKLCS